MAIPKPLEYAGANKEFQFRDNFVMPLLVRLGFGVVVNYHGSREFGRDVIFGDVDRFGHVVYYGMQLKYEASIGLADSHSLIQDAEQATHNPFKHPQTGREEYISCFYVANAGDISDAARSNFFSTVVRRGVRDARLLDGNALLLLDKAASLSRSAQIRERLAGMLQEVRRNNNVTAKLIRELGGHVSDRVKVAFPIMRCRNIALGDYLSAPFAIPFLPVSTVDIYWETVRMLNYIADSINYSLVSDAYRKRRAEIFQETATKNAPHAAQIETTVVGLLLQLGGLRSDESAHAAPVPVPAAGPNAAIEE